MARLPTGTVTFLFTDIEGSTRLVQHLGDAHSEQVFAGYRRLLLDAVQTAGGHLWEDQGESFLFVFQRARDAVHGAVAAQRALATYAWPEGALLHVRMGMHTGEPVSTGGGYVGVDVHRVARICQAGHGGQILLSEPTRVLIEDGMPEEVALRDLGEHRLKDLARSLRLFQVVIPDLPADFPPLRSLDVLPNNLPIQLTSFIGREDEMAEIKRLMKTTRLLTLTGAGGSGKTRLGLHVAADLLDEFPHGVWLGELARVSDPALVPEAVASALNIPEDPGRALTDTLVDALQPKKSLIILDNCEHLIAACVQLANALLRACPNLRILATSREGLGTAGETVYPVPPLSSPEPRRVLPLDTLKEYEAVRLFVDRATAVLPTFRVTDGNGSAVAQVCHQLDGIPLAIELAAARAKVLSPEEIAARLDDRFRLLTRGSRAALPRHQTLRAAMDWSYDLLSHKEQAVLRRLSVFAGGFTLDAAEAICAGDGIEPAEVLDLLAHLVDKSLVTAEGQNSKTRYQLLETVRQYGRDRLLESGEAVATRWRHLDWFLVMAEEFAAAQPKDLEQWLDRLEREHDNLRAALGWAREADPEQSLRLAAAVGRFWDNRGYVREGLEWLEDALSRNAVLTIARARALWWASQLAGLYRDFRRVAAIGEEYLALARSLGTKLHEARALNVMGDAAIFQGYAGRAAAYFEESLALYRELGTQESIAGTLRDLGEVAFAEGDHPRAIALLQESLERYREMQHRGGAAYALSWLGMVAELQGQYQRARVLREESLTLYREIGARHRTVMNLVGLARVARAQGDYDRATTLAEEGLSLARDFGSRFHVAQGLVELARVALDQGHFPRATVLCEESLALGLELGVEQLVAFVRNTRGTIALYQGDNMRATALLEEALKVFRGRGATEGTAYSLNGLGCIALRQGDTERAAALARESLTLRRGLGHLAGLHESLESLAAVAVAQGQHERAALLFGAAEAGREAIGAPLPPVQRPDYEQHVGTLRVALGERASATAWAEGRAMTLEQAIEYALSEEM